jgi:hypothetical protein
MLETKGMVMMKMGRAGMMLVDKSSLVQGFSRLYINIQRILIDETIAVSQNFSYPKVIGTQMSPSQ